MALSHRRPDLALIDLLTGRDPGCHAEGATVQRLRPLPAGNHPRMGLFSRHSSGPDDLRDRDYVLTGCPLVAQDDQVVLVDATVRLVVRQATDDEDLVLGYNPAEETATHAVCVVVLRLMAASVPSEDLLVGRARVAEALEQGLAFAPVGAGVSARVQSVEVRPYAADLASFGHEFRIVSS